MTEFEPFPERRKFAHVHRPGWGLRRCPPRKAQWSREIMGSEDHRRCIRVLCERPPQPMWLGRLKGWYEGMSLGGTGKLRAYYAPEWMWDEEGVDRPEGYWEPSYAHRLRAMALDRGEDI